MPETPLPNDPASRTPTGEIKDPGAILPTETTPTAEQTSSSQTSQETAKPKEDEGGSLLNPEVKEGEAAKAPAAPDKYEFKVPDGFELSEASTTEFSALAKGLNLTNEQAQSLLDFHAKQTIEGQTAAYNEMREGWRTEAQAHPELKGKLAPGGPILTTIGRALDSLPPGEAKAFKDFMNTTGAGDNAAFIVPFYRFAQMITEGKSVTGSGPSKLGQSAKPNGADVSTAQAMYPNHPSALR